MNWNIIADSSCDLFESDIKHPNINFRIVPFSIRVGEVEYIDNEELMINDMMEKMEQCSQSTRTSCPSVGVWYEKFLEEGNVIAITITSQLSGSYNSANIAKQMVLEEYPDKKIEIIDSKSTGPELILIIEKLCQLIEQNLCFDDVIEQIYEFMNTTKVTFALSSFDNLVKNGRIGSITGIIAKTFGVIGIGIASRIGTIQMKCKVRGKKKAIEKIIQDMQERGLSSNKIIINHCQNLYFAEMLKDKIFSIWPNIEVVIKHTRGLCSIYAEKGGLIIGF